MKKFSKMDDVTLDKVENDLYISVENLVYKKIHLSHESANCYYSEREQHLIKVHKNKVDHYYCILKNVEKDHYQYLQ
ncbi:MAG: hypothetical protein KBT36_11860 [Kurthia sp.]|nr:hypothetical protein [Candidatus Kurthia equi]